jgi:phosphoglycerol geranylgeranyltransferase
MKIGKIEKYIQDNLDKEGALLFVLIDPVDYKDSDDAVATAYNAVEGGADIVLIGGSTGAQGELLEETTKRISEKINVPVVLFPGNIATVTKYADAVYFMSLLNARNPYWITQAQMLSAPLVKSLNIEPLPVGYIVVQPGGTVGWVGDANMIPREKPKIAASLALAGEFLGNRIIVTDAGSNPQLQGYSGVPLDMIREVRRVISVPYIVAGGIKTVDDARNVIKNGGDIIQVGTAIEKSGNPKERTLALSKAIKEEGKRRR